MAITHTITRGWAGQNGSPINPAGASFTGSEELNFTLNLAGGATNTQFNLVFAKASLQSIFIYTDAENVTLKTNSSGAPQDTLTITAGEPWVWDVNSGITNPFAGNVTAGYVTNSSGSVSTNFYVRCLTNG